MLKDIHITHPRLNRVLGNILMLGIFALFFLILYGYSWATQKSEEEYKKAHNGKTYEQFNNCK